MLWERGDAPLIGSRTSRGIYVNIPGRLLSAVMRCEADERGEHE